MVLLTLVMLRKGGTFSLTKPMFTISKSRLAEIFKLVALTIYENANFEPRMWTHDGLTNEILDNYYAAIVENYDPFYAGNTFIICQFRVAFDLGNFDTLELASKFRDPRPNSNRRAFIIILDSTKVIQ